MGSRLDDPQLVFGDRSAELRGQARTSATLRVGEQVAHLCLNPRTENLLHGSGHAAGGGRSQRLGSVLHHPDPWLTVTARNSSAPPAKAWNSTRKPASRCCGLSRNL
jgi:hypothetical protein